MAAADEAFALSPISARATLPSEADYDAIREAFMETARGRWFLGEYAKRNRNADTSMVLDAVARIESAMAAQKQPPPPSNELPDALVLIRGLLSDARDGAARTMSGPDAEEALAAINRGTRIIREIAWTLREYGTDARICDMLDTQVNAIEASHFKTIAVDKRDAVLATFDLLIRRIGELGGSSSASPMAAFESAAEAPAETAEASTAFEKASEADPTSEAAATATPGETAAVTQDISTHDAPAEVSMTTSMTTDATETESETTAFDREAAEDMAVLDVIALEMAEPEMAEPELVGPEAVEPEMASSDYFAEPPQLVDPDIFEPDAAQPVAAGPALPEHIARPEHMAAPTVAEPGTVAQDVAETYVAESNIVESEITEPQIVEPQIVEPAPETAIAPAPEPVAPPQPSLGASLIANGLVTPRAAQDALAPIRRMSQAERIAFFS